MKPKSLDWRETWLSPACSPQLLVATGPAAPHCTDELPASLISGAAQCPPMGVPLVRALILVPSLRADGSQLGVYFLSIWDACLLLGVVACQAKTLIWDTSSHSVLMQIAEGRG